MKSDGREDYQQFSSEGNKTDTWRKVLIFLVILCILAALTAALTFLGIAGSRPKPDHWEKCSDNCSIILVESIPANLTFPPGSPSHVSTFDTWMKLINIATKSIDIASYYWTLNGKDIYVDPTDKQGEEVYAALLNAGTKRGITIRIAQNEPNKYTDDNDTRSLQEAGAAQVRSLDFNQLIGSGILHTKLWIVDQKHVFVGSPNMDWRSLTQVKELSVAFFNCSCVGEDAAKLFEVYWTLGEPGAKVPSNWPSNYSTPYNMMTPMQIKANESATDVYFSSSPPQFCPDGRTNDIDAILDVMDKAEQFIHIAVMEYYPFLAFGDHPQFWPLIDDKLRSAAWDRGISVRLLASSWEHTNKEMFGFLQSLAVLNNTGKMDIEVKVFVVPATPAQAKIPYARVNHNKYMVTDKQAYIGTSNWSEDYFVADGGVGAIINQTSSSAAGMESAQNNFRQQVADVFERDWNSDYATYVI
ncbi:5'-3' exonuclease PLD3-like isoform X2 [Patiria miniata]|uniref:PLD phosphodiesterase domain-containing protein n=1 Tax=Patiria miniata TaxID=46514 RepID=A0A913Z5D7_PATMI|nr:5'-3' exonuclease PLD3-like isoform X2 [Patiria miniata]